MVQFTWVGSAVPYLDNIDGVWHYTMNSDDGNQYWIMSDDEMNLTRSNTVLSESGGVVAFFSVVEYDTHWATLEAGTLAILANHGIEQSGAYYAQLTTLLRLGVPPDNNVYRSVQRSMQVVLKKRDQKPDLVIAGTR